jgi:RsiW-degrading membrane proteinase PrsW (M82 family)
MAALGFDSVEKLEKIAADDRANARAREVSVRDKTPMILSFSVTGGFFGLLFLVAFHSVPPEAHDILLTMIGSLGMAFSGIVGYYFGSSAGSAAKTEILAKSGKPS